MITLGEWSVVVRSTPPLRVCTLPRRHGGVACRLPPALRRGRPVLGYRLRSGHKRYAGQVRPPLVAPGLRAHISGAPPSAPRGFACCAAGLPPRGLRSAYRGRAPPVARGLLRPPPPRCAPRCGAGRLGTAVRRLAAVVPCARLRARYACPCGSPCPPLRGGIAAAARRPARRVPLSSPGALRRAAAPLSRLALAPPARPQWARLCRAFCGVLAAAPFGGFAPRAVARPPVGGLRNGK